MLGERDQVPFHFCRLLIRAGGCVDLDAEGNLVPQATVMANVTMNDAGNILEGTATGSVVIWTNEMPVMPLFLRFHIEADPNLSTALDRRCLME